MYIQANCSRKDSLASVETNRLEVLKETLDAFYKHVEDCGASKHTITLDNPAMYASPTRERVA